MGRIKLTSLKPRVATLDARVAPPLTTATQRVRGSRGVADRNRIRERDCGLCQVCKSKGMVTLGSIVDHIEPLWAGGSNDDENKQLVCKACHDVKTAREAAERGGSGGGRW